MNHDQNGRSDTAEAESDSKAAESAYRRDDYWNAEKEDRPADDSPSTGQGLEFQDTKEKTRAASSPEADDAAADSGDDES